MDIPSDDGLKWFDEGFDGFPKRLPDDTIEYMIYVLDSKLNDSQIRSRLNDILKTSLELSKRLLKDYVWQREVFALSLKREENRWLLSGRTAFGDSIADEWLIVYLLRELSRKFDDAWIRVCDSDGEFLLIEAAGALSNWMNPEIADHRVWINRGQLRIIPLEKDASGSRNISQQQALNTISTRPQDLLHSDLIEEEAFYRLQKYPAAIQESMHSSLLTVPRKIAYLLHERPSFTSPAVEAFYLRDPISLRPLNKFNTEDLIFPPQDFFTISTRFNKASFAQLKAQEFALPKAWENAPFTASTDPKDVARRELGMKLTCGFEMLVQDPQNKHKKSVREIRVLLEELESGEDHLPTDAEIETWPKHEDSEKWMDINFEDLERILAGKAGTKTEKAQPVNTGTGSDPNIGPDNNMDSGFGDKDAQDNLRRMVERFEKWMNDEDAGADGAELDEMDRDNDDDDSDELGSSGSEDEFDDEDKAVSFDENEFKKMMRQMMGMPDDELEATLRKPHEESDVEKLNADESEDEEIRLLSQMMEAELMATGALDLDPTPKKVKAVSDGKAKSKGKGKAKADSAIDVPEDENNDGDEDGGEGAVNIDYNLVKNMLEAFKGQTGLAGPAGNMMGLMGIAMPRDEKTKDEKS